jgi:hypothetical protein
VPTPRGIEILVDRKVPVVKLERVDVAKGENLRTKVSFEQGVNVIITVFCDFSRFSAKKCNSSLKKNANSFDIFWRKYWETKGKQNVPNGLKISTLSNLRSTQIYPNWYFWFEKNHPATLRYGKAQKAVTIFREQTSQVDRSASNPEGTRSPRIVQKKVR